MRYLGVCKLTLIFSMVAGGCVHPKQGTPVEIVEMNGRDAYVSGAAGVGKSKTASCRMAVSRAAKAVAHRFAQERDDLADDLADELEIENGGALLYEYVNHAILSAPVADITYDPMDHSCMATVRWQPPVFMKAAVTRFAKGLEAGEARSAEVEGGPSEASSAPAPAPTTAPARTGAEGVAPAAPAVNHCERAQEAMRSASAELRKKEELFNDCTRRTQGDPQPCYRYQLYVEKAEGAYEAAKRDAERCQGSLPPSTDPQP